MSITVEQFVAELGWEIDSTELKQFKTEVKGLGEDLKRAGKWVAASSAAMLGLSVITNKATAEQYALSVAVGASAETMEALAHSTAVLGFDFDKTVDLVEELRNKFGELESLGKMASATDALKMLNLKFSELKDLAPEEQFIRIMDAAKGLEDSSIAVSAVDMLMGGDANKILGHLRTLDGSLGDIVQRYRQLVILNDEGRQGAVKFTEQWNTLTLVGKSLVQQFSGQLGETISPIVSDIVEWSTANKELIRSGVGEWVSKLVGLFRGVADVVRTVNATVQEMGGYEVTIKRIGAAWAIWKLGSVFSPLSKAIGDLRQISSLSVGAVGGVRGLLAVAAGTSTGGAVIAGGAIAVIGMAIEDIYTTLRGGKGLFYEESIEIAKFVGQADEWVASLAGVSVDEFRYAMVSTFWDIGHAIDDADTAIGEFVNNALWSLAKALDGFGQWGDELWAYLYGLQSKIVDWAKDFLSPITDALLGFGRNVTAYLGFGAGADVALPAPSTSAVTNNDNRQYNIDSKTSVPINAGGAARDIARQVEAANQRALAEAAQSIGG